MKYIPIAVSTRVARSILVTQKNSPTILFGAGIVGVVATAVLASKATLRLDDEVITPAQKKLEQFGWAREDNGRNYTEKDEQHDKVLVFAKSGIKVVQLYTPTIIVGGLSIAALTGSHKILTSRNAGLSAAYAALDKSMKLYRDRVIAEYGEDKDRELRFGSEERTIVSETKSGELKKKKSKRAPGDAWSIYSKFFGMDNQNWSPVPEVNVMFLRAQQNWANDRLRARGHVFLNEVYESVGLPHTRPGSQVGWLRGQGDGFVDFGIWDDKSMARFHDFVIGQESEILLDFNVDGEIWKLLED